MRSAILYKAVLIIINSRTLSPTVITVIRKKLFSSCLWLLKVIVSLSACYIFRITMDYQINFIVASLILGFALAELCPEIISRKEWEAKPPKSIENVTEPVPYVVIHHTYIPAVCNTTKECKTAMRSMQSYHQDDRGWNDIGYNFCIGGDGNIYEGRGWGKVGAHAPSYNNKSIGICYIGDYRTTLPSKSMLKSGEKLIQCGMKLNHISENYKLIGHRQVRNTACPGDKFFEHVKTMPHWTDKDLDMVNKN